MASTRGNADAGRRSGAWGNLVGKDAGKLGDAAGSETCGRGFRDAAGRSGTANRSGTGKESRRYGFLKYWLVWAIIGAVTGILTCEQAGLISWLAFGISGLLMGSLLGIVTYPLGGCPKGVAIGALTGFATMYAHGVFAGTLDTPHGWADVGVGIYVGALCFAMWGMMKAPIHLILWAIRSLNRTLFPATS
jgi:hypothetical protein